MYIQMHIICYGVLHRFHALSVSIHGERKPPLYEFMNFEFIEFVISFTVITGERNRAKPQLTSNPWNPYMHVLKSYAHIGIY